MLSGQPANIGPQDVLRASSSNVPRMSPKDPIWLSRGRPDLTSQGRPNLRSWGRPEMTSRGHLNLTFKGRWFGISPGRLIRDLPSSFSGRPLEELQCIQTWMSKVFFNFSFRTYSKPVKLLKWSIFCKISEWLFNR